MANPTDPDPESLDPRRKRLLFRARRCGIHENDILLGRFAAAHVAHLDEAEIACFERLLDENDIDVFNWVVGRVAPPPEHATALLDRIKNFIKSM